MFRLDRSKSRIQNKEKELGEKNAEKMPILLFEIKASI